MGRAPGNEGACAGSQTGGQRADLEDRRGEGDAKAFYVFTSEAGEKQQCLPETRNSAEHGGGGRNDEPSLGQTKFEMLEGCPADSCSSRCSSAERSV